MTYTDHEDARRIGDLLAKAVDEDIEARGLRGRAKVDAWLQEYQRRAKGLGQARVPVEARRSPDWVDPMARPIENPTPEQLRRAKDNVLGETAAANCERRSPGGQYTEAEYTAEIHRLEQVAGFRYHDDATKKPYDGGEAA